MAAIGLGVVLSVGFGCTTSAPRRAESQAVPKAGTEPVQTSVGPIQHPLKAAFGTQLVLLGYNLKPDGDTLKPGETVTITWYWQVIEPLQGEWTELTHITSGGNAVKQNCDGVGDIRKSQPPQTWTKGQIVVDRQVITLKKDYASTVAQFRIGLYSKGNGKRLKPTSGPSDQDARILGPKFKTGVPPPPKAK